MWNRKQVFGALAVIALCVFAEPSLSQGVTLEKPAGNWTVVYREHDKTCAVGSAFSEGTIVKIERGENKAVTLFYIIDARWKSIRHDSEYYVSTSFSPSGYFYSAEAASGINQDNITGLKFFSTPAFENAFRKEQSVDFLLKNGAVLASLRLDDSAKALAALADCVSKYFKASVDPFTNI